MRRTLVLVGLLTVFVATATAQGGGGFGGGGIGGGGFGGSQAGRGGNQQQSYEATLQQIENTIRRYLDGNEVKNILTPGEYSEWPLTLKAGQVVIAEARSDAFDPALEIVDKDAKVLATNDDRFPGDQRPLLLWRCEKDGAYNIRGRCFRDKAGGQFFLRMKVYESVDLATDKVVERRFEKETTFLVRVPMKAGQVKRLLNQLPPKAMTDYVSFEQTISPTGLPDIGLAARIGSVFDSAVVAPVDGDYYVLATCVGENSDTWLRAIEVPPVVVKLDNGVGSASSPMSQAALWSVAVKKGDLIEVTTPELNPWTTMQVSEQPDVSKYSLKTPEANPFFPVAKKDDEPEKEDSLTVLPSRARDGRVSVVLAQKDMSLWIACSGQGPGDKPYTLSIKPAARAFTETGGLGGRLKIGNTDYWAFDAKAGDVMTFSSGSSGFAESLIVRDPDLATVYQAEAHPDQAALSGSLIAQKPGRYLFAVSSIGGGGGGDYTLERKVYPVRAFQKGTDATGSFANGQAQVWKFSVKPEEPVMIHWKTSAWTYSVMVCDENGVRRNLPLSRIDDQNSYGILSVEKPTTYLLVLVPNGSKADFRISLSDLPGYAKRQ